MDKKFDEIHETFNSIKLNKIPYIANSYIKIRITNILITGQQVLSWQVLTLYMS